MKKIASKAKPKNPLWVGIHIRRTDYQRYEISMNFKPLKPSYYLMAMDKFRDFYPKNDVIFVIITDDIGQLSH